MRIISNRKIESLRNLLDEKKIGTLMLFSSSPGHDSNIEYLTGFRQERYHSFSCLFFSSDKTTLIVSGLDYDQACREADADEIIQIRKARLREILGENLKRHRSVGIIESILPLKIARLMKGKRLLDAEEILMEMRSIKESKEIELIKKSCSIANHGIKIIEKEITRAMECRELALILEAGMKRKGAEELAFPTLITSGKRGLYVHPYPSVQKGRLGNMGLIDFGARFGGYCFDVTVPFATGDMTSAQRKMICTVMESYEKSMETLEVGKSEAHIFDAANEIIKSKGFEFKHSLGHGIGLDVHEYPNLSPKPLDKKQLKKWKDSELKANMVFTIEPGVYEKSGGIRIENDILLTKKGPRLLTRSRLVQI